MIFISVEPDERREPWGDSTYGLVRFVADRLVARGHSIEVRAAASLGADGSFLELSRATLHGRDLITPPGTCGKNRRPVLIHLSGDAQGGSTP